MSKLHNAALRIIFRQPADTRVVELHRRSGLIRLEDWGHMHACDQTYKGLNELAPISVSEGLVRVEDRHGFHTRSATHGNLVVPSCRLQMCTRDYYIRGPFNGNMLGSHTKECKSLYSFKSSIIRSGLLVYV